MKIKSEDILKPGAILEVKKIDFNDPEIKALFEETIRQQKLILSYGKKDQAWYDNLRKVITI